MISTQEFHKDFPMAEWQNMSRPWTQKSLGGAVIAGESISSILTLASSEESEQWNDFAMNYAPIPGSPSLRAEIAKLYPGLRPENIMVFSGAQEAINALYSVLLTDESSSVLGLTPCYTPLNNCAKAYGATLNELPLQLDQNKKWTLDTEELSIQIKQHRPSLLTLNFPHNPTGYLPTPTEWNQIIEICQTQGVTLLSDEVFRGLEYNDSPALKPACLKSSNAFSLGSISKAFGGQALRIGWVASQRMSDIKKLATVKRYFSVCPSALDDFLATILLRNKKSILEKNNRKLFTNEQVLKDVFAGYQLLDTALPKAGPVCFPKLNNNTDAREFCLNFVKKTGLRLEPGYSFGSNFDSHFRLSLGGENFKEHILRLRNHLEKPEL